MISSFHLPEYLEEPAMLADQRLGSDKSPKLITNRRTSTRAQGRCERRRSAAWAAPDVLDRRPTDCAEEGFLQSEMSGIGRMNPATVSAKTGDKWHPANRSFWFKALDLRFPDFI
jgi:hypothetical protein